MATPYVVLNANEWQTRCRVCPWRSDAAREFTAAYAHWLIHVRSTCGHSQGAPADRLLRVGSAPLPIPVEQVAC